VADILRPCRIEQEQCHFGHGNVRKSPCRTLAAQRDNGVWGNTVVVKWGWMMCGSRGMERIQYQHADAKMQMRGWMNAVYGNAARLRSVARQRKRDAQEVKHVGLPKMPKCASTVWTASARGAENAADVPDYCTSTRRLRSRMYFPSLYFWDCSYALSYQPANGGSVSRTGMARDKAKELAHIFPAEYGLALAAIDVSHGVVACSHLTVIRFTFDNVNPVHIHPLASTRHDRASIRSYTSSNR